MKDPVVQQNSSSRPKAVGLVRGEVSGLAAPQHAVAVERHARALGLRLVYIVRPPQNTADPVGYALGIAAGLGVMAIVVYDLAHVDNQPARICEDFDLETVCPAQTWARAVEPDTVREALDESVQAGVRVAEIV